MSVPGIVQSQLDGEQVAAQVPLGGEDVLFVTPTRTLIYRADGLLSDESVEEYSHDAERIEISEGRRKSAIELDFGIEGAEKFKVPSSRLYEALHPVLAGVLNAADVTGPEETVKQTYQFSELTLVITSERVVKHVGAAVWDEDYEEFRFADVTALDVEEGSVSSQIIIESDGRPQRIKTPSDQTREVRERIERALLGYHDVASYEEFAREVRDPDADAHADAEGEPETEANSAGGERADPLAGGVEPIDANPPELDDDGAIIDDDASVTTGERAADPLGADRSGDATETADSTAAADAGDAAAADRAASTDQTGTTDPTAAADQTAPDEATHAGGAGEAAGTAETADASEPAETVGTTRTNATTTDASADSEPLATASPSGGSDSDGFADSGFEPASSEPESDETAAQLEALTEAVERQNELLAEQQQTLEQLIDELSRGR